ncbi:MAG: glycosyltransferase, partial [Microgenomates group bacterium]
MKKLIKIGLYNPFLDTLGGGEKHILSIIATLSNIILEENKDVEINIFWNDDLSKKIEERFSNLELKKINWISNFKNLSLLKRFQYLFSFDYFFYVTDGSYFFSLAKKNFVFCMVPDKKLYQLNLINKLKLFNFKFISNSPFTSVWLKKWGIKSITIEPYIDNKFISNSQKKEKIILSVGRFFSHLHQKNHQEIIKTFINLQKNGRLFKEYKLILAGGLKNEDKNYFEHLKKLANKNTSIIFKPNINDKQ